MPCINERNVRCNWIQANILKRTTGLWVHYTNITYIVYIYRISPFVYPWTLVFISVSAALTFAVSVLLQYSRWQLEKFIEPTCGRLSRATLRRFPAIMTPLICEPSLRWKCCQSSGCAGCCSRQSTVGRQAGSQAKGCDEANVALLQSPGHNWQPASRGLGYSPSSSLPPLPVWKTKGCRTHKTDDRILLCWNCWKITNCRAQTIESAACIHMCRSSNFRRLFQGPMHLINRRWRFIFPLPPSHTRSDMFILSLDLTVCLSGCLPHSIFINHPESTV